MPQSLLFRHSMYVVFLISSYLILIHFSGFSSNLVFGTYPFPRFTSTIWASEPMVSSARLGLFPSLLLKSDPKHGCGVRVRSLLDNDASVSVLSSISSNAVKVNGVSVVINVEERVKKEEGVSEGLQLQVLWDDGYGTNSVKDYLDVSKDMIKPDGGPPRWFCPVECGSPLNDSPVLLFLPGMDGTGLGLILHHKSLGKVFEVRCLHIPVYDRTPFEGLINCVEEAIRIAHSSSPNKPIYLVGDSLGGCLALAVAARNPTIDLVLVLVNPATSFGRSQLQYLLPILEALPDQLHTTVPYLFSLIMGDPVKMAMVDTGNKLPRIKTLEQLPVKLPPIKVLEQLSGNLTALLPRLSELADIIPKETLIWKLKLLKSAAAYANSRLHAVQAEVLVLASGRDNMIPSDDEAKRLMKSLKNCNARSFKANGHTLLLEDGFSLLTAIKGTGKYRRLSRKHDYASDFLPPSASEYKRLFDLVLGSSRFATSPVTFSTLEDGRIVRGLSGVPSEGPVLYVGYHMLMALEVCPLIEEVLREKNILVRTAAHPEFLVGKSTTSYCEFSLFDWMKIAGAFPVSPSNLYKLLSTKAHVLLYPGGARESLHLKGEEYKLFWPDQPEFVRMAARFGASIVPFSAVGEDDLLQLVLDQKDLMKIPIVNDYLQERSRDDIKLREGMTGDIADQSLVIPGLAPKVPGRVYILFGKPIETKGRREMLKNPENANELYRHIRSQVEENIAYLLKKRDEDPYRSVIDRTLFRALDSPLHHVPTFEP